MEKILNLLLSLSLIMCISSTFKTTYASTQEDEHEIIDLVTTETNYFESLLKKKQSLFGLNKIQNTNEIQNVDLQIAQFKGFVDYELSAYSDDELKNFGYTEEQIKAIKKPEKNTLDYITASISITTGGYIQRSYNSTHDKTLYTVYSNFSIPAYSGPLYTNNNFAIASVSSINQPMRTTGSATITYRYFTNGVQHTTSRVASVQNFNGASKFSFPVGVDVSNTRGYVSNGDCYSSSEVQGNATMIDACIAYGYATKNIDISFGLSVGIEILGVASTQISLSGSVSSDKYTILGRKTISS